MEAADKALEQMYLLIGQRERGAKKLQKLARELEALREKCNKCEVAGSTVAVAGYASMVVAGVATFYTGGLAAPALAVAGSTVGSIAGSAVSVGAKVTEYFRSSSTLEEAKKIDEDCKSKAEELQELFKEMKAKSPFKDPDQEDQYVLEELMGAMGRRSGLSHFDPSVVIGYYKIDGRRVGQRTAMGARLVSTSSVVGLVGVLAYFSWAPSGKKLKLLLSKGSQKVIQGVASIGLKTAVKAGARVVGGTVGLIFSLREAIDSWEKLLKGNHVTKASDSLRKTAELLLKATEEMKQLNEFQTMFDRLKKVELCIQNPQRSLSDKMPLIEFAIELCHDEEVKQWLKENTDSLFFKFLNIFDLMKKELKKEDELLENEIDIVFVAHGSISEALIPSSCLLPSSSIKDVLLYSPWNCAINSRTAYGIASGRILPQHREFYCTGECPIPHSGHRPAFLPNDWNSMKNARGDMIPNIMVSPLGKLGDTAWKFLTVLRDQFRYPYKPRVVIPFILDDMPENMDVAVPFFVVTLALSLVLFFTKQKATVHLAACLSKMSDTELDVGSLINQYSYTIDETWMSCSWDMFPIKDRLIYRLLKAVFD